MMWDWLRSPEQTERSSFGRGMTPATRAALMDELRRMMPPENRPDTFEAALGQGMMDMPMLDLLLSRYRQRAAPPASSPSMSMPGSGMFRT